MEFSVLLALAALLVNVFVQLTVPELPESPFAGALCKPIQMNANFRKPLASFLHLPHYTSYFTETARTDSLSSLQLPWVSHFWTSIKSRTPLLTLGQGLLRFHKLYFYLLKSNFPNLAESDDHFHLTMFPTRCDRWQNIYHLTVINRVVSSNSNKATRPRSIN